MRTQLTTNMAAAGMGRPMKTLGSALLSVMLNRASRTAPKMTKRATARVPNLPKEWP